MKTHAVSSAHLTPIDLLGERLKGTFTAEEAMEKGKLGGWNLRKVPSFAFVDGKQIPRPGMFDVVRDNPETGQVEVVGKYGVSESYRIVQNEEHAEFLNTLVEESGANFELAGHRGNQVFLSMKLPGHINVAGVDPIENSLLAMNSHDGSMAFTLAILPVRYACSNVLNVRWSGLSNMIRIRHTSGAHKNIVTKAREALEISFDYLETFQAEADRLINTELTQQRFEEIIEKEFGAGEDAHPAVAARAEARLDKMAELFADAQTQDGIRDTAWAGFNALVEWSDHFAPTRGGDVEVARAQRALLDPSFKDRALDLMLQLA